MTKNRLSRFAGIINMKINLIKQLSSPETLNQALQWLITARKEYSANNDIWHLLQD